MINTRRFYVVQVVGFLLLLMPSFLVHAQNSDPQRILVRNVILFDPTGTVADKLVNILLLDKKLELITEDKISRDEADLVVNAREGVLLGKLVLGEKPSFIIFNEDPRDNFKVMMNTYTYSVFAVEEGTVVRNRLIEAIHDEVEEEPQKVGWLAYTPPPFVVPLNYLDSSKWNQGNSRWVSGIFTSALLLDRMWWGSQNSASEDQFPDLSVGNGGEIRGFRFGVIGTINFENPWIYTIFAATNAFDKGFEVQRNDDLEFLDVRLDIPFFKHSVMSIGKQKEPISGERIQSMLFNQMQERAAVSDALLPSRNIGVVWSGYDPDMYSTWAFGLFNDWLEGDESFSDNDNQAIGRLTWAPLHTQDDSNLIHLGIGYRYSDAKLGVRYKTEPEFNKSPIFIDTGFGLDNPVISADRSDTWNAELSWRRGSMWLASEYTRTNVDSPDYGNPSFDGYWADISWVLSGEMREYNKKSGVFGMVPVAKSVYQNGNGAWELSTRWSSVDLDDGLIRGGKMDIASMGLTWWLNPTFGISANYRYIWNELDGNEGTSSGINTRVILILQ